MDKMVVMKDWLERIKKRTNEEQYKEICAKILDYGIFEIFEESNDNIKASDNLIQDKLALQEQLNYDELNPYFVTKYSKATEKEDRAEIFAEIMILSKKPKYLFEGQNIRKKAEVMNNTISQNVTNEDFSYSKYFK